MTSIPDIWGLQPALDSKTSIGHHHKVAEVDGLKDTLLAIQNALFEGTSEGSILISSVEGLTAALDSKALLTHEHVIDQITGLPDTLDALATTIDAKADVDHSHSIATPSAAGFMSASDKAKLDGLGSGEGGGASTISEVDGLQAALDGKAAIDHTHLGLINLSPVLLSYTISQSSSYAASPQTGSYTNLTDGFSTTGAGTDQGTAGGEWIKANLGSIKTFSRIELAGGTMGSWGAAAQYLNGAAIEVSNDDSTWQILIPSISRIVDTGSTVFATGLVIAQYVRLWRSGYLGTTSFKIFG